MPAITFPNTPGRYSWALALCLLLSLWAPLNSHAEGIPAQKVESSGISDLFSSLGNRLGLNSASAFLPPDQAFHSSIDIENAYSLVVYFDIGDEYYLYKDKFGFEIISGDGITLGQAQLPPGKEKYDEAFGLSQVYYDEVAIRIPLERTNLEATPLKLLLKFQGCADKGFCYPPLEREVDVALPKATTPPPAVTTANSGGYQSEQDRYASTLATGSIGLTLLSFFGLGLLLTFTPCVFPMIPILSGIIAGQGSQITTRKAFTLSLVYVLAMASAYTIAGVLAGLFGGNLQAVFQTPWVLITFSLVFVALAFSMFGFYELQLPNRWQSKLTELSNKQRGGTLVGAGVMGFLSALIVGPCVAAPLAGALIYIGQTGDAMLGGAALFALSLGMGTPLLILGTSAGKLLPKAGAWMNNIKAVFGVLLLAVAIWLLERIIPAQATLLLWAALFVVSAIYLGALDHLPPEASGWRKLWKGCGVILLIYGIILSLGAASGGKDPLKPLAAFSMGNATAGPTQALAFKKVKGVDGLQQELALAQAQNRPVMLDFYADWCVSCKQMERETFSAPGVQAALSKVILLKADVTANDEADQALLAKFGLYGPPSILFFNPQGQEQTQYRLMGFVGAQEFETLVRAALNV